MRRWRTEKWKKWSLHMSETAKVWKRRRERHETGQIFTGKTCSTEKSNDGYKSVSQNVCPTNMAWINANKVDNNLFHNILTQNNIKSLIIKKAVVSVRTI